jgi:putative FmdB family regulatory protein
MPTYKYQCQECKVVFEAVQSMNEMPLTLCRRRVSDERPRTCGGQLKRLLYPVPGKVHGGTPKFYR